MNCPYCGCMVAPGSSFCPACRKPLFNVAMSTGSYVAPMSYNMQTGQLPMSYSQRYAAVPASPMGYSQPYQMTPSPVANYSQPYASVPTTTAPSAPVPQNTAPQVTVTKQQNKYPSAYTHSQAPQKSHQVATSFKEIPYRFFQSFRQAGTLLRELVQTNGVLVSISFLVINLFLTFLAGMLFTQAIVSLLFTMYSTASGIPIASTSISLQQGVSYVASQISVSMGAITVLWQVACMVAPLITMGFYLRYVCKIAVSPMLLLGFVSVTTTPGIVSALLCIILSFFAPWFSLPFIAIGFMISYLQITDMLAAITMQNAPPLKQKLVWYSVAITLTLVLVGLILSLLFGQLITQVLQLLSSGVGY